MKTEEKVIRFDYHLLLQYFRETIADFFKRSN